MPPAVLESSWLRSGHTPNTPIGHYHPFFAQWRTRTTRPKANIIGLLPAWPCSGLAPNGRLIQRSEKSATRQQASFYKGFIELFGWQHSGNGWQHVAAFRLSVPQKLYKFSHLIREGQKHKIAAKHGKIWMMGRKNPQHSSPEPRKLIRGTAFGLIVNDLAGNTKSNNVATCCS